MQDQLRSLQQYQRAFESQAEKGVLSFVRGGSADEIALENNRSSFERLKLLPRMLRGVHSPELDVTLFGDKLSAPILLAPSAYHGLLSEEGELDTLNAANQFGSIMVQSMFSSIAHADVVKHKNNSIWLQMYLLKDRGVNSAFLALAKTLQYDALVLTVDAPIYAKKEREAGEPLRFPDSAKFEHLERLGIPVNECIRTKKHLSTLLDPSISWKDLEWVMSHTDLPIILKGVLDPRDTALAMRYPQVKGVIVSNHGGRQLDAAPAGIEVLQMHKEITQDTIKLFVDGGVMRGSDIFKAVALGANAVLVGRPVLWGLFAAGSSGVFDVLDILRKELLETMTLAGCHCLADINSDYIFNNGRAL